MRASVASTATAPTRGNHCSFAEQSVAFSNCQFFDVLQYQCHTCKISIEIIKQNCQKESLPSTLSIFGHTKRTSWRRDPSTVQLSIKMTKAVKNPLDDPGTTKPQFPEEKTPSPTDLFVRDYNQSL